MDLDALELSQEATLRRFNKRQDRVAEDQGYGATEGAKAITRKFFQEVSVIIEERLKTPVKGLRDFKRTINKLDPHVLACASLSCLLHSIAVGDTLNAAFESVGRAVQGECWAAGLLQHDGKLHAKIEKKVRSEHSNVKYRKQAARSIATRAGFMTTEWTRPNLICAGSFFVGCCIDALPDILTIETVRKKQLRQITTRRFPQITPAGLALAEQAIDAAVQAYPVFLPCTQPPKRWTAYDCGGYWDKRTALRARLVRSKYKATHAAVRAAMKSAEISPHLTAVNSLQSVAWTINKPVLDAVQWAYDNNVAVGGVPSQKDLMLPERLSEDAWSDEDKQRAQRYRISKIKERNRGLAGNRMLLREDTATASRLASGPEFYTPINCDWRGRMYGLPHFNFTRDDRVRALFLFASGMPIGVEGLKWLKVHVANCGDFDKISKRSIEERVAWTEQNIERIKAAVSCPKEAASFWTLADKPFLFLSACLELSAALAAGPSFLTSLPVSFDGSCSGLQHLCAMTRAAEGYLVNLVPSDHPQDIYQTVADIVKRRVETDAQLEFGEGTLARLCLAQGITRKLVKRNVMTYAYSATKAGMAEMHIEDTMRPLAIKVQAGELQEHPYAIEGDDGWQASRYLARHIYGAIESVVTHPAQAKEFLRKCAQALAHEGKVLAWTSPTGMPWANRYHKSVVQTVRLWLSDQQYSHMNLGDVSAPVIRKDKAANAVAPNLVHALDASHLALTVNAAVREGITNLATVHDSFGCLAPQAPRFREIIREQFVEMYEEHDVLAEVLVQAQRDLSVHNSGRLPTLPQAGPLDLKEVLNAEYAFA